MTSKSYPKQYPPSVIHALQWLCITPMYLPEAPHITRYNGYLWDVDKKGRATINEKGLAVLREITNGA